jgi:chromosome segregation ATPase
MEKETMDFLKHMFTDMQEGMTRLDNNITTGFKDVNGRLDKVESRLDKVESRLDKVESRLVKLETGQEQINDKLEIIAEVQQNHINSNEKQHNEIVETLTGKLEITENVIRHITRVK